MKFLQPKQKRHNFGQITHLENISFERPPVWDNVCAAFGLDEKALSKTIFTYGKTIYNPGKLSLNQHEIEHERIHMQQQGDNEKDAALWWGRYLRDKDFRVDQEARAYARQYDVLCEKMKGRNERFNVRMDLAAILCGPLYEHAITRVEAAALIYEHSKTK